MAQLRLQRLCISDHGAELVAGEDAALLSDPYGAIQNGTARVKFDGRCNHHHKRGKHDQAYRRSEDVDEALSEQSECRNRLPQQFHHWEIANVPDRCARAQSVKQLWYHVHGEATFASLKHHIGHEIALGWGCDEHFVHKMCPCKSRKFARRAYNLRIALAIGVKKALHYVAQVLVL